MFIFMNILYDPKSKSKKLTYLFENLQTKNIKNNYCCYKY